MFFIFRLEVSCVKYTLNVSLTNPYIVLENKKNKKFGSSGRIVVIACIIVQSILI